MTLRDSPGDRREEDLEVFVPVCEGFGVLNACFTIVIKDLPFFPDSVSTFFPWLPLTVGFTWEEQGELVLHR